MEDCTSRGATNQPDGRLNKNLSSPSDKNKSLSLSGKSVIWLRASHPNEGRVAIVTNARWDAVDAKATTDERGRRGRRSRVVLAPRCWRQVLRNYPPSDGGKKAGHRGEHEVSRNPSRRESRIASAGPVCSCAHFFVHTARETAGAARTRLSLRPLLNNEGGKASKTRANHAARTRTYILIAV
jgi:hypothetical protein